MASGKIDVHSLRDITDQEISIDKFIGTGTRIDEMLYKKSAHRRDDHYLFIFQKKGRSKVIVDFKEIELIDCAVLCILPGQIHYGVAVENDTEAWLIILDTNFVNEDFRSILEDSYFQYEALTLPKKEAVSLNECIKLLASVKKDRNQLNFVPQVTHTLISACIGMVASAYKEKENNNLLLSRSNIITLQFKRLLLQRYKTFKSTSDYAIALHMSPSYLNEVVKTTTGFAVGYWIQQAIMMEAKRQLYATDATVKEIAYSLGFADRAYFTRYFSKAQGQPPLQFRLSYRK